MRDAWERQSYDTEESWPVFTKYRDQGKPRRVPWGGSFRGDPILTMRWYREHFWKERIEEYDRRLDAIKREVHEAVLAQSARDVAAETLAITSASRRLLTREITKYLTRSENQEFTELKPNEIARLLHVTSHLDRLFRGESTETIGEVARDLSHLTDEELDQIEAAMKAEATE